MQSGENNLKLDWNKGNRTYEEQLSEISPYLNKTKAEAIERQRVLQERSNKYSSRKDKYEKEEALDQQLRINGFERAIHQQNDNMSIEDINHSVKRLPNQRNKRIKYQEELFVDQVRNASWIEKIGNRAADNLIKLRLEIENELK